MQMEISKGVVAQVILMGRELDRAEGELRGLIDRQSDEAQADLVALMWVGRGAFEADDWDEARATAAQGASTPCADYLIGTPHFSDHLEAGLEAFGISSRDVEDQLL